MSPVGTPRQNSYTSCHLLAHPEKIATHHVTCWHTQTKLLHIMSPAGTPRENRYTSCHLLKHPEKTATHGVTCWNTLRKKATPGVTCWNTPNIPEHCRMYISALIHIVRRIKIMGIMNPDSYSFYIILLSTCAWDQIRTHFGHPSTQNKTKQNNNNNNNNKGRRVSSSQSGYLVPVPAEFSS